MASSRKADFNLNSIGKASNDLLYLNYKALYYTIKYGKKPNMGFLEDKEAAEKRMAELDKIYARGERPPLAEKFSNEKKNVKKHYTKQRAVKITDKTTLEILNFESIKQAAKYLNKIYPSKTVAGYENLLHLRTEYKNYVFEVEGICIKPSKDKRKPVIAENLKTGEIIEFESVNKCSHYLKNICEEKIYREKIERILQKDKIIEDWKIRYKEGD